MFLRNKYITPVASLAASIYFCGFLFLINHPSAHNLLADFNYTGISEFVTVDEDDYSFHQPEKHIHTYSIKPIQFCFICNIISSQYDITFSTLLSGEQKFQELEFSEPDILALIPTQFRTPYLRAPPLHS
ncbi:hypothetical protein ACFL6I_19740 [candidate division KSB1 bacterium]